MAVVPTCASNPTRVLLSRACVSVRARARAFRATLPLPSPQRQRGQNEVLALFFLLLLLIFALVVSHSILGGFLLGRVGRLVTRESTCGGERTNGLLNKREPQQAMPTKKSEYMEKRTRLCAPCALGVSAADVWICRGSVVRPTCR